MVKRQQRFRLFGFILLCLTLSSFFFVIPVSASEEEETDPFNQLPNYRWDNVTTTDTDVSEQLMIGNYEIYNAHNETSGVNKYEKSRDINTRDFDLDTRFQIDIGGNTTDWFRDRLNDPCDFTEGDLEGFSGLVSETTIDGLYSGFLNAGSSDYLLRSIELTGDQLNFIYPTLTLRIKTTESDLSVLPFVTYDGVDVSTGTTSLGTNTWETVELDMAGIVPDSANSITRLGITVQQESGTPDGTEQIFIDSIELIGSLDYATHTEEITPVGDTFDWQDFSEFWNDDGNVSDFEDGSTEGWAANDTSTEISIDTALGGYWLDVTANSGPVSTLKINYTDSYTATTYQHVAIEINVGDNSNDLYNVTFYNADPSPVLTFTPDSPVTNGGYALIYGEFNSSWNGTESALIVEFNFSDSSEDNQVYLNYTYLYDVSLGDPEEFLDVGATRRRHVNPEGSLVVMARTDSAYETMYSFGGQVINTDAFTNMTIRTFSSHAYSFTIQGSIDGGGAVTVGSSGSLSAGWNVVELDLSADSDWSSTCTQFLIQWYSASYASGVQYRLDYWLITGHWSESDGYKLALLNQDSEEGMYFQFLREDYSTTNYTLNIDMLDASGIALHYETGFYYDRSTDPWLHLDVDWDLDKKQVKILFEYENQTEIIKTRNIADIYPVMPLSPLLLLKDGFPKVCLNNSMYPLGRSLVVIDYIDAPWKILDWREPATNFSEPVSTAMASSEPQASDSDFTTVSQYGVETLSISVDEKMKYYQIDVDRFDGLSFDVDLEARNIDASDECQFYFFMWNVKENGSLELAFGVHVGHTGSTNGQFTIWSHTTQKFSTSTAGIDAEASISVYYDSSEKLVMQYKYDSGHANDPWDGTVTSNPSGSEGWTKEFLIQHVFYIETDEGGYADDIFTIEIGGFDITRKDILGDIVGAIISPIVGFIQFLLSPIIIVLLFLGKLIAAAFALVGDIIIAAFEVAITALGDLLDAALGLVETAVDAVGALLDAAISSLGVLLEAAIGLVEDAVDAVAALVQDVVDAVLALAAAIINQLILLLEDIIDALILLIDVVIDFVAQSFFFVWDALGLPNVLEIIDTVLVAIVDLITAAPSLIAWFIDVLFFWAEGAFFIGLLIFWLIPILAGEGNAGKTGEKFIQMNSWDILPVSIFGNDVTIPVGFVFWPLLFLYVFRVAG